MFENSRKCVRLACAVSIMSTLAGCRETAEPPLLAAGQPSAKIAFSAPELHDSEIHLIEGLVACADLGNPQTGRPLATTLGSDPTIVDVPVGVLKLNVGARASANQSISKFFALRTEPGGVYEVTIAVKWQESDTPIAPHMFRNAVDLVVSATKAGRPYPISSGARIGIDCR